MAMEEDYNWRAEARCLGLDPEIFFPGRDYDAQQYALSICRDCSVQQPCLEFILSVEEGGGVWGNTTERQRKGMRGNRRNRRFKVLSN
jgi:WhiB family redox-sensing transcriptional regulator